MQNKMNVYYLLEQDFQKLIDLNIVRDNKAIKLLRKYCEQIGQASIIDETGAAVDKDEYFRKHENSNAMGMRFRSKELKMAVESVKYDHSVKAQCDDRV